MQKSVCTVEWRTQLLNESRWILASFEAGRRSQHDKLCFHWLFLNCWPWLNLFCFRMVRWTKECHVRYVPIIPMSHWNLLPHVSIKSGRGSLILTLRGHWWGAPTPFKGPSKGGSAHSISVLELTKKLLSELNHQCHYTYTACSNIWDQRLRYEDVCWTAFYPDTKPTNMLDRHCLKAAVNCVLKVNGCSC